MDEIEYCDDKVIVRKGEGGEIWVKRIGDRYYWMFHVFSKLEAAQSQAAFPIDRFIEILSLEFSKDLFDGKFREALPKLPDMNDVKTS